jgi:PKD domain
LKYISPFMMSYKIFRFSLVLPFLCVGFQPMLGQSGVTIGANTPNHPSAVLELQSTTGGLLYPRLTTTERNAIANPAVGLMIFNTTSKCFEGYFATGWKQTSCECSSYPSPAFTLPSSANINTPATFTASATGVSYAWTFPSGSPATSSVQAPAVTWTVAGTYAVKLVVTNANGCSDSLIQNVTVSNCPPSGSQTFTYNGNTQSFTVPACVTSIQVDVRGAQGGNGGNGQYCSNTVLGGQGGRVQATLAVTPGQVVTVVVGQQGTAGNSNCSSACNGGAGGYGGLFNGVNGGNTSSGVTASGGGGGGASYVQLSGTAVAIGGGGGGGGANNHGNSSSAGGKGGHVTYGGNGGCAAGTFANCTVCSGGGGGPGSGGQGFSSGTTVTTQTGFQSGNGQVVISW